MFSRTRKRWDNHLTGVPLMELHPQAWRNVVGTMTQEAVLFHASIGENVAYGLTGATPVQIASAAERAGLHDLLARLQYGNPTDHSRRSRLPPFRRPTPAYRAGAAVSRGISRILILDEPTTHLDVKARREVTDTLMQLARGINTTSPDRTLPWIGFRMADRVDVMLDRLDGWSGPACFRCQAIRHMTPRLSFIFLRLRLPSTMHLSPLRAMRRARSRK